MAKMFDEVYEAIKREDLFHLLKKSFPFMVGAALFILGAAGGYIIWKNAVEKRLIQDEALYEKGLKALYEGHDEEAYDIFEKLEKASPGIRSLALLQKMNCKRLSLSSDKTQKNNLDLKSYEDLFFKHYESIPLKNAFLLLKSFTGTLPSSELSPLLSPQSAWYDFSLMAKTLNEYKEKLGDKAYAKKIFLEWKKVAEKESPDSFLWIISQCLCGLGL